MRFREGYTRSKWQSYTWIIPAVYRILEYTMTTTQPLLIPPTHLVKIPPQETAQYPAWQSLIGEG